MARRVASHLALLTLGLIVPVAILETFARIAEREQTGKNGLTIDRYVEHDDILGWRKRPQARITFREPEFTVEVAINSHGLRDPERAYESPPSTFRILALGDSFVEGYTVPLSETVTQILERVLNGRSRFEVLNGGTAGYSTDQEYLFYHFEGVRYEPKIVVLFFYFNDILYNARARYSGGDPKPLLKQDGDRLVVTNAPVPAPAPESAPKLERARPRGSALLRWIQGRLRHGAPRLYNALATVGLWAPVRHKPPPEQYAVYRRDGSPEIREAWMQTDLILDRLAREVEARGAHFLVVYVPSRFEVSDRDWSLTQFEYGMKDEHWDRRRVVERLEKSSQTTHFSLLDLTAALRGRDHGAFGGPYFVGDGHWNRLGHETAALEVAHFLRSHGWLPPQ
jgi:hypothetical protein